MRRLHLLSLFLVLSFTAPAQTTPTLLRDANRYRAAEQYAERLLATLSTRQKVAQLVMPMVWPKTDSSSLREWEQMVTREQYGGVLWQKGTPENQLRLTNYMRQNARVPMLVAIDGEWGLSMRLSGTPKWPRNIFLGAAHDEALAYAYGQATAREAKRLGVQVNFAPVLDVNSNPQNPVIGTRSFGSDVATVTRLGLAYARGMEEGGVLSVAKHFPGHGDTSADSHHALPIISKRPEELKQVELAPFDAYIRSGLSGMMVAHLQIPALGTGDRASSASPSVVTDLLQKELGFRGLIFTDGLGMKGIISGVGSSSVAVEVFKAGSDILVAPTDPRQAVDELMKALESGAITLSEVERRVKKVLIYKYLSGATDKTPLPSDHLSTDLNPDTAQELIRQINRRAMTLTRNKEDLLPLKGQPRLALLRYGNTRTPGLLTALREAIPGTRAFTINANTDNAARNKIYRQLKEYDAVIIAVSDQKIRPDSGLTDLIGNTNSVLTFLTSPYAALQFGQETYAAAAVAFAYGSQASAQTALGEAITGAIPFQGVLPVDLSPYIPQGTSLTTEKTRLAYGTPEQVGMDAKALSRIDEIANEGVREGAYPGCQVLVAKDGYIIYEKAFGTKDSSCREPVDSNTVYDVASVTKAAVTTPLLMMATAEQRIRPQDRLGKYLGYLQGSDKEHLRLQNILHHAAGLPAIIRFYEELMDPASYERPLFSGRKRAGYPVQIELRAWAQSGWHYQSELVSNDSSALYPTRMAYGYYLSPKVRPMMQQMIRDVRLRPSKYRYSDIDFLLLQDVLETEYGLPLDSLFYQKVADPLGATRLRFRPYAYFAPSDIAEGQDDRFLRRQTLRGDVDDEAAAMLGGVSGNAGLFANAHDLAKVLEILAREGNYGGVTFFPPEIAKSYTTARHSTSPYAMGFDRHRGIDKPGNTAEEAPLSTYGHTGFTGTCFWVDPEHHLTYIFLSNRCAPKRWNNKLSTLKTRKRIQSVLYEALN